jgi:hydrogenase maturation protease
VAVRVSHQLMPEFAEDVSRAEFVVFIDAACDNSPGAVRSQRVEPDRAPSAAFSHQLSPPALLGMAERLYGSCPEACFFSVGARSFEYGEKLSPEVESALPGLIEEVEKLCGRMPRAIHNS